ncbi:molybdopterin molybdotransferase [Limimonas halophila]|uniref:Molybdopterin molybdenumtransferase n=1 Tax=Limimonas halophila TaxID=1082479 RepID=A0A1G7LTG0_9PROT|nr:gephyrin-like molybdotransferase Glp [Limimonas halophila]SDF52733.1 molybdopterin molybdotransferase [Limimonas halophila]
MAQLSSDCFAHGGALMTVDEAIAAIRERVTPVADPETVAPRHALGRMLLRDVVAGHDVPPHANSAVDGFAVHFDDLKAEGETRLPVTARVTAGHPLDRPARRGEAIRIFTGSRMPDGPDTVYMQEDTRAEGDEVVLMPGIARGANVRGRGEDIRTGDTVLAAGRRLRPQDLGQAAAVGCTGLTVARPLRAALFSTGDELREPGQPLDAGCIHDSNRYTLHGLLQAAGCTVTDLGILPDHHDAVHDALAGAAADHDVILTSGGVSVGEEDHVKQAVEAQGSIHTWKLAIKPGRPIALGQLGRTPFVGMPGNPVAVMVTFITVVQPMLEQMLGGTADRPRGYRLPAAFDHRKKPARREWLRARLVPGADGTPAVEKVERQGSGVLSAVVESDGLVELAEDTTHVEAGSVVDFLPYSEVAG